MEQKVSHIIAEMPTDAQCCPAQIFNVLFYVVCFPRAWAVPWKDSAGLGDAVTLCPVPSVPGVPMSLVCPVSSGQCPHPGSIVHYCAGCRRSRSMSG